MKIKKNICFIRDVKAPWSDEIVQEEVTRYSCGDYEVATFRIVGKPETWTRFEVHPMKTASSYAPSIYHSVDFTGDTMGCFCVGTASYGSLNPTHYGFFLKAYEHAGKVVNALTDYFIKGVR